MEQIKNPKTVEAVARVANGSYPNLDKLSAAYDSLHVGGVLDFLDWLGSREIVLVRWKTTPNELLPLVNHAQLLDEYLVQVGGVDLEACERERKAMLAALQGKVSDAE